MNKCEFDSCESSERFFNFINGIRVAIQTAPTSVLPPRLRLAVRYASFACAVPGCCFVYHSTWTSRSNRRHSLSLMGSLPKFNILND